MDTRKRKYKGCKINGVKIDEHRYVMQSFLGRKLTTNEVVHHIDGNKLNNDLSNLEVMSRSDHSRMHMLEREPLICTRYKQMLNSRRTRTASKLNPEDIPIIKSLLEKGERVMVIAEKFGVTKFTIYRVKKKETWSWVD